jgi:hypothetical protein
MAFRSSLITFPANSSSHKHEYNCAPQMKYIYIYIYCTMLGSLTASDHQLYRVTSLKTPVGLLIPLLQSQSHVTTITHNYFLRCYAFTQLQFYTFITKITYSTHTRLHSLQALHTKLLSLPSVVFTYLHHGSHTSLT